MQKKYETYEQLFTNTIGGLTENSEKWLGFLETASRMYKYSFEDQLLIYAQRPETRACADFSFWTAVNRMNRQLRQGCNEIALLDQEKKKLHYVYAMEDTEPRTNGKSKNPEHYIWQLAPDNRDVINNMLCRQGDINSNNIEKTIISMTSSMTKLKMAEYISEFDNIFNGINTNHTKSELETAIAEISAVSAAYMTAQRTGTDISEHLNMDCFSKLSLIDNSELTAFLGRVTTDTAGAVLKLIERNVTEHKIQERSSANELTKGENRERNTLRSERGNNDISPDISRGQRGGHTDDISLRQNEREVSQGELQSNIQQDADVRRVSSSSGVDRRTSSGDGRKDSSSNGESGRNGRRTESKRSSDLGRSDEQLQTGSSRDNSQGTDRSILSKEAEETKPSAFSVNEEAIHNAFNEFKLNHSFSNEQQLFFDRIEQFAAKNNVTENIIDRAFSERPVYRRTYGNRDKLSQNLFNHSLKVLESELERAIRKNLAENNEKIAVSVDQETSEAMNVHSEKTEGQEMAKYSSKNITAVNDDVSDEEIIISLEDEIFEHNAAVLNNTQVDDVLKLQENGEEMYFRVTTITDDFMISMERVNEDGSPHTEIGIGTKAIVGKWKEILAKENENSYIIRNPHISNKNEVEQSKEQAVTVHTADDIELGDIFSYKGREYTVVSMQGIYPDDVGISYNETMSNGTVYAVTENVDRHKLAREGIYLGKSDKLTQESTAIEYSEVTRSMYQTDNPDVLIIEGKGSLAKIDITPTEELWNRLAEKGVVRTNESVDRIIFNTDNINWNKLVIPDKWGNMTNNIDIDKVFTENEVRIAQSVADDVITPTLEGSQLSMFDEHITDDIILPTEEAPEEVLQVNEFENKQSEIIQDNTTKTDFTITDDKLGEGGAKTKFRANVEAIKTLKTIESEERTATPEEQEILSKYVGWGGLKNAFEDFHDDWKKEFSELKELLTPEEYKLAKASVLNAHYTSPLVIEKMYEALRNNGFTGGKILEPAIGIGNYFGKMPEDIRSSSNLYGVELDDISGRIAKQLYQNANIRITGFEKTLFKDNSFDLAIGNVPFGAYSLNEPKYNKYYFQIHDHFFAKALDKVKPGGIVAFITSKGTLDKKNPDVRKYIAERAELVGAIRLPNNAFKNNAGTEVTSDIIFLQKRENPIELTPLTTPDWVHLGKTDNGLPVNQYFIDNPQMVLGNIVAGNKLYGHGNDDTMCVAIEGADLSEQLSEAIKHINFEVLEKREEIAVEDTIAEIPSGIKNFSYAVINDKIYYRNNDEMELFNGKKSDIPRIKAMVDIRDTLRELIACQLDNGSDEQLHELQTKLNTSYDSFVAKYGRLNDKTNVKAIKEDSSAPLLSSLEIYKGEEFSGKAAIFEKRTILAKNDVTSADTSSEALTLSLAKKACVDMEYMQELTGFSEEKILSELNGVVFENPMKKDENGKPRLETSDEYLSGNIRTKLEYMKAFHTDDNRYTHNIAALEAAMPPRIEAADIDIKLGAPCIKPEIIQQFMYETFNTPRYKQDFGLGYKDSVTVQYADINSTWFIANKNSEKNNTAANSKFGTQRCSAYELLEECLNMKNAVVRDTIERDGKKVYVLNQKETDFAQEKQRQLQETFKSWIFADAVRREEVVETYNRMFNSIRPREYDGSALEFPGMNSEIQLRKHQRDAVAHALYGGNTLFAHEVGAGKTFEMIAAAMEGKRLGLHQKAMICVPNHLTEQIGSDFVRLYPNANILVATTKDFSKNNRRKLFGKIATGDYDGIIIGHSQLTNLPVSKERQQNLLEREIDEIVTAIGALKAQSGQDYQVKQLEKTKKTLETKLQKLIDAPRRDDVVDFEELGIDKLILDEAHDFKNLFIATKMGNISGISTNDDVQKTFDLYLKCQYLDEITNNKGLIFATGTPVSNSISEIYNMQKYLQSDLLRETGLNHFDMWAANFAETVTESQLSPEGNKYQMKTRFAKFNNLPELMALFKECADIKTADMLGLKTPECTMHSVVAQPSGIQKSMIENLAERAKRIRLRQVDRKDDNMPMITNDGRKIGLDQRLMNPDLPDDKNSKLNMCINNVYDIWDKTAEKRLTQVIFCDLGVPQKNNDKKKNGEHFCVYDDIKNKLIEKGVPADEIAFIHDAATEEAKDKLFAKVRKGDVRVIIGSTKKMGTGTNIQTKLVALHDLDAPWRPADMEQRRGRMVRQGNENEHVDHFRYVTEGTFDAYLYQMLENKQKFISQIMTSKSPVRSCQDMDEVTLSYAEVKALSAGNPLIKEKMDLDIEVSKLKMLKSAHENNLYKLQNEVTTHLPMKIQYLKNEINGITADIEKAKKSPITYDSDGKAVFPSIEVNGKVFTDKEEAGKALIAAFQAAVEKDYSKNHEIGNYRGFKLLVGYNPLEKSYGGMLQGEAKHITTLGGSETGNFTRLDNLISTMDRRLIDAQRKLDGLVVELEEAKTQLDVPFPREEELREKTKRLDELTKMLEADADDNLAVADNTSEKTTSITDPYYLGECTPGAISILEKNDIYFETHIIEDKPHVKINAKDKDTVHALLEERPKLTL